MKNIIIFLSVLMLISCAEYRKVSYKAFNYDTDNPLRVKLMIPKGYKLIKNNYDHSKEYHYIYSDSSIIFISNNKFSASRINKFNRIDKGIDVIFREHINDTILMEGKNDNAFWKEALYDNVVIGYLNVQQERKEEFDKVLTTIIRK